MRKTDALGQYLKEYRERRAWTQAEMTFALGEAAQQTPPAQNTYSRWENGSGGIPARWLPVIAELIGQDYRTLRALANERLERLGTRMEVNDRVTQIELESDLMRDDLKRLSNRLSRLESTLVALTCEVQKANSQGGTEPGDGPF